MNRPRLAWIAGIATASLLVAGGAVYALLAMNARRLPYHDSFAKNKAAEWTSIGGNWQLLDGAVVNRSDESGAKLLTGSSHWKDYELDADVKLIGHDGDIGLIARVSDEEPGADSYSGYYIGLRSPDSALVIGRADHGWMEGRPAVMAGGVQIGVWYHLHVVLVGCDIGAKATNLTTNQTAYVVFHEERCVDRGKIGLRSMSTGGSWRNIRVQATKPAAFAVIRAHSAFVATPIYPKREDDFDHMREAYFRATYSPARSYRPPSAGGETKAESSLIAIATARNSGPQVHEITLRGAVTQTSPLYIQDNSGAIEVQLAQQSALNLGDEVEVTGRVQGPEVSPHFLASSLTLRGDRTLVVPVSVTSTQAAGGAFDGRLVELRGTLREKKTSSNQITLLMEDADQTFRAVDAGDLSLQSYAALTSGSELRIRGICTVNPGSEPGAGAFTILLRSMEDVEVLAGPPWWSPRILPRYILLLLALITLGFYVYIRVERWKMRAILDERERLAYNMHDTLAQSFAGVGFHLQGVRNGLRSGNLKMGTALEKLEVACDLVTHTHREASDEIAALHPDYTESVDILTALQRSTRSLLESDMPHMELVRAGTPRVLSMPARDALFKIGREAISNVLRHSSASTITLRMAYESSQVVLDICDNGQGFSYAEQSADFGIRGMRHRAEKAHGSFELVTEPGHGVRVTARVPYGVRVGFMNWLQSHRWPKRFVSR